MCSYNSINGIPSCASRDLLYGTAREAWGFEGYITADCDAVETIEKYHHYTNSTDVAVALGMELLRNWERKKERERRVGNE